MIWPGPNDKWHKLCPSCHSVQTYGRLRFARDKDKKKQVCRSCKWEDRYKNSNKGGIPVSWFTKFKTGAKARNIEFSLSIEDVVDILEVQSYKCALSGVDLSFQTKRGKIHRASIDRIDSSKGYFKDNIQIVDKDINKMKLDHSQEYFISLCKRIAEYNS